MPGLVKQVKYRLFTVTSTLAVDRRSRGGSKMKKESC